MSLSLSCWSCEPDFVRRYFNCCLLCVAYRSEICPNKKKRAKRGTNHIYYHLFMSTFCFMGHHCTTMTCRCPMRYSSNSTAFYTPVNEMKQSQKKYINLEIEEGGQSSKWFVDPKQVSFLFWRSLFLLAGSIQDFGRKSSRTAYVYVSDSSSVSVRTKTGFFWNEKENSGILNKLKIGKCESLHGNLWHKTSKLFYSENEMTNNIVKYGSQNAYLLTTKSHSHSWVLTYN